MIDDVFQAACGSVTMKSSRLILNGNFHLNTVRDTANSADVSWSVYACSG